MSARPSRTILANTVSDVMNEQPTEAYRRAMAAVTPRKLWQALPGDCVVMLAPCSPAFQDYVAEVVALDIDQVDIVAPPEVRGVHALDVVADLDALGRVTDRTELKPFVPDAPVLEFGRRTGMRILPYAGQPDPAVLDTIRLINTKHGFREIASGLGLPVADGGHADTVPGLVRQVTEFLSTHPAAIVKANRGSNGFGNVTVHPGSDRSVAEQVHDAVGEQPQRSEGWIYEEFLPFTAAPSIEMEIDDSGVRDFYTCDQRTVNNAWTGMVTPAVAGPYHQELRAAATAIGNWLHGRGYRGIFDVDCGVYDGGYVVTEANVRRTGGSYLEDLARLLRPGVSPVHWRADVRRGSDTLSFAEAAAKFRAAGLADPGAGARAVLTADTLAVDGKWRYLVVGGDAETVAEVERHVEQILGLA